MKNLIAPVNDNIYSLTREQREAQGIQNVPEKFKNAIKEFRRDPLMLETLR